MSQILNNLKVLIKAAAFYSFDDLCWQIFLYYL